MTIQTTSYGIPYVYRQTTTPSGTIADGSLWYNTSTDVLSSYNGTSWVTIGTDLTLINYLASENALSILDIEAQSTLTGGQSASMVRDVYFDNTGYLNTVDSGNTDAFFDADKFKNSGIAETFEGTATGRSSVNDFTATCTALSDGFISEVFIASEGNGSTTYQINIIQDGVTLATKEITPATINEEWVTFADTDYSPNLISSTTAGGVFTVQWIRTAGTSNIQRASNQFSYSGGGFEFSTQYLSGGSDYTLKIAGLQFTLGIADKIIQTNALTVDAGATSFQIFTLDGATIGTGSIDYDISFDNDAHIQTAVLSGVQTAITNTGTQIILKQNLNTGASSGEAEARGYGVMFW